MRSEESGPDRQEHPTRPFTSEEHLYTQLYIVSLRLQRYVCHHYDSLIRFDGKFSDSVVGPQEVARFFGWRSDFLGSDSPHRKYIIIVNHHVGDE